MSGLNIGIGISISKGSYSVGDMKVSPSPEPPIEATDTILLESGNGFFLTEDGGYILLEEEPTRTINKSYWNF